MCVVFSFLYDTFNFLLWQCWQILHTKKRDPGGLGAIWCHVMEVKPDFKVYMFIIQEDFG